MTKLFCISDVHGFYDEMIKALNEAGFEPDNPDHLLIGLGDYIDRGRQPMQVVRYLHNLPNKVLIKGNHEDLFEECCQRGFPYNHDVSNGTYDTIICINASNHFDIEDEYEYAGKRLRPFIRELRNYYETENYIFCHAWIPLKDDTSVDPDWRNASAKSWEKARWTNPFKAGDKGLLPDKTIVFGHWGTIDQWTSVGKESYDPYFGYKYIGIDGCTVVSGQVNCLVLEDNLLKGSDNDV